MSGCVGDVAERVTSLDRLCAPANPSGKLDTPYMTSQVQEGQRPKAQSPLYYIYFFGYPTGGYQVNEMVNGSPTSFLLDTGAAVILMRKHEWDHISLGTELEPWAEHNLVSVDGTPLLIYGHATVDLSLGEQTNSVAIVVVGTRAILGIVLMKYNGIVDVGKAQLILGKAAPLELHRGSRQMQESISVHLEKCFRLPLFRNRWF